MRICVSHPPGKPYLAIHAKATSAAHPEVSGFIKRQVGQGNSFLGWSYDELKRTLRGLANPSAMVELEPKPGPMPSGEVFLVPGRVYVPE